MALSQQEQEIYNNIIKKVPPDAKSIKFEIEEEEGDLFFYSPTAYNIILTGLNRSNEIFRGAEQVSTFKEAMSPFKTPNAKSRAENIKKELEKYYFEDVGLEEYMGL